MLNVAYMTMFYLRHCGYIPTRFMFSLPTLQSSSMRCIFVLLDSFGVNIKFLLEVLFTHTLEYKRGGERIPFFLF